MKPGKRLQIAVFALALALGMSAALPVLAQDFTAGVQALDVSSYKKKAAAVEKLAATGDPRVVPVLEAMINRRLYTQKSDGRVVIAEKKGSVYILRNPLDLKEIGEVAASKVKRMRVNNRVRRAIRGALGGLTLLSDDPKKRRTAAESIFKARDAGMLPILERAIARETDDKIKRQMLRALAATQLTSTRDTQARIKAISVLEQFAQQDVQSILRGIIVRNNDGTFAEADEAVRTAAANALKSIERTLANWRLFGDLFRGISLGSVLLLAAVGLAITFGVMGVINMAHGEMLMLGAYTTFVIQGLFNTHLPGAAEWSLAVAVPTAFLVAGAFGVALERG